MKRIISFVLLLAVACSLLAQIPYEAKAYDATLPLPILTGDMAQDVANIATSQLGYAYNDGTAYGAWWSTVTNWGYDYSRLSWCAMFACWCAYQAGAGMDVAYNINGAKASMLFEWQKENATYNSDFTVDPQVGDFMYFGREDRIPDHVAIVTAYDKETKTVYMVGGNQGNGDGQVTTTTCPWYPGAKRGSKYVLGFGRPNYRAAEGNPSGCAQHQYDKGVSLPETNQAPAMNRYTCNVCGFVLEKPAGIKSGTCGEKVSWTLDNAGKLTVYGNGPMADYGLENYTTPTSPFYALEGIKEVVIKSGVTTVGAYAFCRQRALERLMLPDSLTTIGAAAFSNCASLGNVKLPGSLETIGMQAFCCCDGLTALTIPNSVTKVGEGAFLRCRSLKEVVVGTGVTTIEASAFSGCFSLRTVKLHFGIKKIQVGAFSGCSQLKTLRYQGDATQWNATQIAGENQGLKNVTLDYIALQGWVQIGRDWYYYNNGNPVTGWLASNGQWYYFDANGKMMTGWLYHGKQWYYLNDAGAMQTGWVKDAGQWYYLDANGCMVKGWQKLGSTWYYFKTSGEMVTGWKKEGSTWYYLQSSGAMQTGWLKSGSVWYYFNSSGAMVTGSVKIGNKTYDFGTDGICKNP